MSPTELAAWALSMLTALGTGVKAGAGRVWSHPSSGSIKTESLRRYG
jgi:hypothetical protein